MDKIFSALSSAVRREIITHLSTSSMTAGEIAKHFDISKPSLSKHLSILENAGLVEREKKGQYVHYKLIENNLSETLLSFLQNISPNSKPIKKESKVKAKPTLKKKKTKEESNISRMVNHELDI